MADFLTVKREDGSKWVRIDRLDDGHVMCCMCVEFFMPNNLYTDFDGQIWDYCWACACFEHPTQMTWPS